jgi:hypothetical protein
MPPHWSNGRQACLPPPVLSGSQPDCQVKSPGALLTPAPIWAIVEAYRQTRLTQAGSGRAPLLCTAPGERWDAEELGKRLAEVLQEVAGRRVSMHSLRRGFATFTLLRWAVARGRARWPAASGTWSALAGSPESLVGVLESLRTDATLVLYRLARLLGHARPGVTAAHYLAADVLAEAWVTEDEALMLRPEIAAELLQCSRQALYKRLRPAGEGGFDAEAVLRAQMDRLERRRGGARRWGQEREAAAAFPQQQTTHSPSSPARAREGEADAPKP